MGMDTTGIMAAREIHPLPTREQPIRKFIIRIAQSAHWKTVPRPAGILTTDMNTAGMTIKTAIVTVPAKLTATNMALTADAAEAGGRTADKGILLYELFFKSQKTYH